MQKIKNTNDNYSLANIDWPGFLLLTLTPILSLFLVPYYFLNYTISTELIIFTLIFYALTAGSITTGYHRLFSHRSYQAKPALKLFLAIFGAGALQNSILKWASDHRRHHTKVDTDLDPYSVKKGFFHAHIGWMLKKDHNSSEQYIGDLGRDPIVQWQHKYYLPLAFFMSFGVPLIFGFIIGDVLGGVIIGGLLRLVVSHHFTFFINSLCHMWGGRPYSEKETARDNFLLALFTFGEGYHNFHHTFQLDYRNGIKWYHYDPTKWIIKSLSYTGLAWNLKTVPEATIQRAKLETLENQLLLSPEHTPHACMDKLITVKSKIIETYEEYDRLVRRLKRNARGDQHIDVSSIKLQIEKLKYQGKQLHQTWMRIYEEALLTT